MAPTDVRDDDNDSALLVWVRKRDGSVVSFDESKLASSILAARHCIEPENASLAAQELTKATLHFLKLSAVGGVLTTLEIEETVVKVLREVDQAATAAAYFDHGRERRRRRSSLRLFEAAEQPGIEKSPDWANAAWDKSALIERLVDRHDLEPEFARQVAGCVERQLFLLERTVVRPELIRELVASELVARGVDSARFLRGNYGPNEEAIAAWLTAGLPPYELLRRAGRSVLSDYAVERLYSPDIAGLARDGHLELFDAATPGHWAAMTVGTLPLAARSEGVDEFLERLPLEVARLADRVDCVIAIEAFDSVVALLERSPANAGDLSSECFRAIELCARQAGARIVINLHGCIPDGLPDALGDGPLFAVRATEQQERLAATLARELADRIVPERKRLPNVLLDYHPDLRADPADFALTFKSFARHLISGDRFRLTFDRDGITAAEGLPLRTDGHSAVYSFVGLRLDRLQASLGEGRDQATFLERVGWLAETAIRAASQKREFVRRQQPDLFAGRDHDRAAAVLVPLGLQAAIDRLLEPTNRDSPSYAAAASKVIETMERRARRATRPLQLLHRLDAATIAANFAIAGGRDMADLRRQLRVVGEGQQALGGGAAEASFAAELAMQPDEMREIATYAAFKTALRRLACFTEGGARQPNLASDWFAT